MYRVKSMGRLNGGDKTKIEFEFLMIIETAKESTTGATTKVVPTTTQAAPLPPNHLPPNFGKRFI